MANPVVALIVVVFMYAIIDRWYIGALPDFIKPLSRWQKIAKLKGELPQSRNPGQTLYELGALQVESGHMKEGLKNLEKAHDLIQEHPDIEYYLGVARIKTGAFEAGKTALENALRLNPKIQYGFPYVYLLECFLKKEVGQFDLYTEKIVEFGNPQMYYEVGVIFQKAGYPEKAKEMFREARLSFQSSPAFLRKQQRNYAIRAWFRSIF
ncbi:MAG: hypothetical protein LLG02_01515 [Pelosinus sp.]|nr:hypothetical protein [Pelosinus sp.]